MSSFGLGLKFKNWRSGGAATAAAPTNSVLPKFVDAAGNTITAPIVGQQLFINVGTWANSPTSYAWQAYDANGTIADASGTATASGDAVFVVQDAEVGLALHVGIIASNGTPSTEALSTNTSAVTDIDLNNAITAFTRTSATTVTPMLWSVSFGANVREGYILHAYVYSDSGLTTLTQDVIHVLTTADLQSGATIDLTSDGFTTMGATDWLKLVVETTSPNGIYHGFPYPTPLTPTDAVAAMTWSTTDKTAGSILSNGNMTVTSSGTPNGIRASRAVNYDLTYWEVAVTGAIEDIAVADSSAPLGTIWGGGGFDGSATTHAGSYILGSNEILYNGSGSSTAAYATGVTWGVALDRVNKLVWFAKNNAWQNGTPGVSGGLAMASIGTPIIPAAQLNNGATATPNFGTTPGGTAGFTYTPPTGFVAP